MNYYTVFVDRREQRPDQFENYTFRDHLKALTFIQEEMRVSTTREIRVLKVDTTTLETTEIMKINPGIGPQPV